MVGYLVGRLVGRSTGRLIGKTICGLGIGAGGCLVGWFVDRLFGPYVIGRLVSGHLIGCLEASFCNFWL